MADWIEPTVVVFPFAAWMCLGVGIPWALALLPRDDWRARVTVITVGMALGPLGVTAWMFALGTWGRITLGGTLAGSAALALLGSALAAWRFRTQREGDPPGSAGSGADRPTQPAGTAKLSPAPRGIRDRTRDSAGGIHESPLRGVPFSGFNRLLIAGIALVLIVTTLITAWWPFIAYDTQWVYGYNARIFLLEERIPGDMGYYPQLVPLSYTFMQQAWNALHDPGTDASIFNDHAARAVVPWFNVAMALMAYVLGRRAFGSRRVGLLTAAIWTFYPHVAAWSGAGDLEIPLTLYMTGAAAFFIDAWRTGRSAYAILSGVLLSGALWTKPTGGALALGVLLAVVGWGGWCLIGGDVDRRVPPIASAPRRALSRMRPKIRIALIAGIASAPLGGMWYVRNLALGHAAVVFPASYWHNRAQRSGQEFGWLLLIALLVAGGLMVMRRSLDSPLSSLAGEGGRGGEANWLPILAIVLLLLGILPTALNPGAITDSDNAWLWLRGDLFAARRLDLLEVLVITAGFGLLAWSGRAVWRLWPRVRRETILLIWALMLPYAVVWFFDFSYHYRLSFAIVPLAAVQVAALIHGWLWDWLAARRIGRVVGGFAIIGAAALAVMVGAQHTVEALRAGVSGDTAKYDRGNPALMVVVHRVEDYAAEHGPPVVAIPGEDRLPFFFPTWDIRNSRKIADLPTRTEDLTGVDLYIENSSGDFLMQQAGIWPNPLSAEVAVAKRYHDLDVRGWDGEPWPTVLEPIPIGPHGSIARDDGEFYYSMFTLHPDARDTPMRPAALREDTVVIGDLAQFIGHDMGNLLWVHGERIVLSLYWRPTDQAPSALDYSLYIHLLDTNDDLIAQWDDVPLQRAYSTRFWRPGESLLDYWVLRMPDEVTHGPARLKIGLYLPATGERLPVFVDGEYAGDGIVIEDRIEVR